MKLDNFDVRALRDRIKELEEQRLDLVDRLERMRRSYDALERSNFTVGSIIERTPQFDYALQILEMHPTPNGQYIVVQGSPSAKGTEP